VARGKFGGGDLGRGGNIEGDDSAHWVSPCVLMWRPPAGHSTLAEVVPLPEILPPAGYTLGQLSETGSAIANDSWEYGKTEQTRAGRAMPCINNQLTVGLRVEATGDLVSERSVTTHTARSARSSR
jgi:hypothetical protein